MGGPNVACQIYKTALSHVTVARNMALSPVGYQNMTCRMSLTILGLMLPVEFNKRPCCVSLGSPCRLSILRMPPDTVSILRNGCVALSILRV